MMSTIIPCPGLIHNVHIPPPLPMKWQIAMPYNESIDDEFDHYKVEPLENIECDELDELDFDQVTISEPQWFSEMSIFHQKPITIIPITDSNNTDNDTLHIDLNENTDNIQRIMTQFGDYPNYSISIDIIVNGYIHNLQSDITSIIPSDINNIIVSFYNVTEYKYIHFAYKLYKSLHIATKDEAGFSGKTLISTVEHNHLHQYLNENVDEICDHLIKYKVIVLTSYKMKFLSFMDLSQNNPAKQPSFVASDDYIYGLNSNYLNIFQKYSATSKYTESM